MKDRRWLAYTIAAALSWAAWGVLTKFISAELTPYNYQILFTLGMLSSLPFVISRCKKAEVNIKGVALSVSASVLVLIGNIFVYKSFMLGGQASVVLPYTNLYPVVTILIALLVFKEKLYLVNVIGIIIVIPAIVMLSGQSQVFYHPVQFFKALDVKSWLLFASLSLLLFGVFSASQKLTSRYLSAEWSYVTFILAAVLISICFIVFKLVDFNFSPKTFLVGASAGLFDGLGVLFIYGAYRAKGKAAQVSSIVSSVQQVFTICLALIFLKEQLTLIEVFGIALAIVGSWLILKERTRSA